jgi:L-cystine transport system substrate-binding protein
MDYINLIGGISFMKRYFKLLSLSVATAATFVFVGCSSTPAPASSAVPASSQASSAAGNTVKRVVIAHTQTYAPYDFVNDKGDSDGFEVQVLKAVDELLPQYEFEYAPTSDDDLLIGVESGKYNIGVKGAWFTEERAKKYVFPKNNIAASVIGLTFRSENADQIKDMESFAKFSGKLVPIAPQNAQWAIVEDYNKTHPDNQVNLVASEAFTVSDAYTWLLEGRYDAYFNIKLSFQNNVTAPNAPYHDLADKLAYVPYKAIPTYPVFNKNDQALADAYDEAIVKLRDNGTIAKLSQEYFGEDIFAYIQ